MCIRDSFGMIPEDQDMHEFIRIAGHYLGCGEQQEVQKQRKRDMDFQQDWKYIVASFMSDYHICLLYTSIQMGVLQ